MRASIQAAMELVHTPTTPRVVINKVVAATLEIDHLPRLYEVVQESDEGRPGASA